MGKTNQLGVLADVFTSDASNNVAIGGSPSGSYKLEVTGSDILVNGIRIGKGASSIASNTAIGLSALPVNTTGTLNTAIGNSALLTNTTGYGNTSVGYSAIGYNTTGFFNAAVGVNALLFNSTGTYNNALGTAALYANTTGSYNTAVGQQAGTANTTGSNNTYIGYASGFSITTGSNNTIIGAYTGTAAMANNIVLADGAGNLRFRFDGTNTFLSGSVAIGSSSSPSYTLDVSGTGYFSGIVGIGVAPSAWYNSSGYATLQIGNASLFGRNSANSELYLSSNAYDNTSGNPTYITTDFAARYVQNDGVHSWLTAPSGTAGTATTFTERMRITQAGNVGIGTSTPNAKLSLGNTTSTAKLLLYDGGFTGSGGNGYFAGFAIDSPSANDTTLLAHYQGALVFGRYTNANDTSAITERMRITSDGPVLMNTTSVLTSGWLCISVPSNNYNAIVCRDTGTTYSSGNYYQIFTNSTNGIAGGITHLTASTVGFYTGPSDQRLKSNIKDVEESVLPLFNNAKLKTYNHIADEDETVVYKGFLAQDMVDNFPEAYGKDKEGYYMYNPTGYIPYLVKAIQELSAQNQDLKSRLDKAGL